MSLSYSDIRDCRKIFAGGSCIVDFDDESFFYNINTCADLENRLAGKSGMAQKAVK